MELKEVKKEGLSLVYEAFITADELIKLKTAKLQKIAETAKIQGFRPGKAPLNVIESQYKNSVMSELLNEATNNAVDKIYKDHKIVTIASPSVDVTEFSMEQGLKLSISMELFPEIEHLDFTNITIEKPVLEVSEKDINLAMEQMANYHKNFEDITEDKSIAKGDVAVIDFVGKLNNIEFEGGKGTDFPLEIGSNMFIPGFEDQLIGKKVNDSVAVKVTFPNNYHAKNLAGQDVVFDVKIKKLQQAIVPTINDELAKRVGFDNLEALKEDIIKKYQSHFAPMQKVEMKKQVIEKLKATKEFDISPKLLQSELDYLWKEFTKLKESVNKAKDSNKLDSFSKEEQDLVNSTDDEIKAKHLKEAKERIKVALVLNDLAAKNNIIAEEKDVSELLAEEAIKSGSNVDAIMNYYKSNTQALQQLQNRALEEKIMYFIFSKVQIAENISTFEEFNKKLQG
ncbi:Trigger factor [Candidatus Hepatincola sp. Av]